MTIFTALMQKCPNGVMMGVIAAQLNITGLE
jgi:hypothetical protein